MGGTPPSSTDLAAHWPLEDGTGQIAADSGPNSIPLTLGWANEFEPQDPRWVEAGILDHGPYFNVEAVGSIDGETMAPDANLDFRADLIAARKVPCDRVTYPYYDGPPPDQSTLWRNLGDGQFVEDATLVTWELFADGFRHFLGDFTGDTRPDVFILDSGPEPFQCGIDCGPPGFDPSDYPGERPRILVGTESDGLIEETTTRLPFRLAFDHAGSAGDIDGDNDLDVVVITSDDADLADCNAANFFSGARCPMVLVNDGSGNFSEDFARLPLEVSTYLDNGSPRYYTAAHLADVDNDEDLDLILGGQGGLSPPYDPILLNDGSGNFSFAPPGSMPDRHASDPGFIASADVNQDGWLDLVFTGQADGVGLFINDQDGTFSDQSSYLPIDIPPDWGYKRCIPADLNDTGYPDLVCAGVGLGLFFNKGDGTFERMPAIDDWTVGGDAYPVAGDNGSGIDLLTGPGAAWFYRHTKNYVPDALAMIFDDGFESGDTNAWSSAVP